MTEELSIPSSYAALLKEIKERVCTAQVRVALAVSRELILLCWSIGRDILARQKAGAGARRSLIGLPKNLNAEFPGIEGFSPRSLKYMRAFAEEWPDETFVQQVPDSLSGPPPRQWSSPGPCGQHSKPNHPSTEGHGAKPARCGGKDYPTR